MKNWGLLLNQKNGNPWLKLSAKPYHLFDSLFAIHEAPWDCTRGEDLIALAELLEQNPVGEALPADPDALKHTVAAQLV